jgi:hypothetical protein
MGEACGTQGRLYRCTQGFFLWVNLRQRDCFENLDVDWRIIVKLILTKWEWGHEVDWSGQDRDRWRAVSNAVMKLRVPKNAGNFLTSFSRTLSRVVR